MCGVAGLATGFVSLRTSGIAFIMITLAFAQMAYYVTSGLSRYGGDDGLSDFPSRSLPRELARPMSIMPM